MFSPVKRINRLTYLTGIIATPISIYLVLIILGTITDLIPGLQNSLSKPKPDTLVNITGGIGMVIYFSYIALSILYLLILIKQRADDITDKSWILSLVALLSIVGIPILAIIPGKKQVNKYGPPPGSGIRLIHH
ncbi:MAG TPA: DUF805 domain-containing protein [Candidatus Saccharimonadia bacterium]|nr:DUF805 domain-containing protein [Candidatus Saccharimonadia bacterium]